MRLPLFTATLFALTLHPVPLPAAAQEKAVVDAMESYLDFVD